MAKPKKKKVPVKKVKSTSKKTDIKRKQARKVSKTKAPTFWKDNLWPALVLLIIPFLIYGQGVGFGYILDDAIVLSENNYVKEGFGGLWKIFTTESFSGFLGEQQALVAGARYRPLSIASFAIEHQLFGLNPQVSHIVNIILYTLTGLLIFRLFSKLLKLKKANYWFLGIPFLTAFLFLLHPVHTEAVANIKGRDEIMALLFALLCMYFVFTYLEKKSWGALLLSLGCYFLGLLAKENTITFLAVIPLSIYFFEKRTVREYAMVLGPIFLVTLIYLLIRTQATGALFAAQTKTDLIMNNPFRDANFLERYATIMYTLGLYVKLLIFPHPLTHDYYPYHIPIINWLDWRALASLALYLAMAGYALYTFAKKSIPSWSILYYIITLSIVSNIVFSVGTFMNERFLYISSLGFTLVLSYLIVERLPKVLPKEYTPYSQTIVMALLAIISIGYFARSYTRVPVWENEMTLNSAAIKVSKNSGRANQFMGYTLYRQGVSAQDAAQKKIFFDQATPYIDKALSIVPTYKDALTSKAGLIAGYYQQDKDLDKLLSGFYDILDKNHIVFVDQYMEYLNPREDSRRLLAFYHKAGFELFTMKKRNFPLAEKYLNYGYTLDNTNQTIIEDLGLMYFEKGDSNSAKNFYDAGIKLYPNSQRLAELKRKLNL